MSRPKKVDNISDTNVQTERKSIQSEEILEIRESSLHDFALEIERYVKKGYKIDLNLHPIIFLQRSSAFVCKMSRENES